MECVSLQDERCGESVFWGMGRSLLPCLMTGPIHLDQICVSPATCHAGRYIRDRHEGLSFFSCAPCRACASRGGRNLRTLFCHGKAFCPSCQDPGQEKKAWPRTCQTRSCQSGFYQLTPGSLSFQRTAASRRMRQSRPPAHSPREPGTLTTTMQPRSVGVA